MVAPFLTLLQTRTANVSVRILVAILFRPRVRVWGAHFCQSAPRLAVGAMGACYVCPQNYMFEVLVKFSCQVHWGIYACRHLVDERNPFIDYSNSHCEGHEKDDW